MKFSSVQWLILLAVTTSVSLIINISLFFSLNDAQDSLNLAESQLTLNEQKLIEQTEKNVTNERKLSLVKEQQQLFDQSITLLRSQLDEIQTRQIESEETAAFTSSQLAQTRASLDAKRENLTRINQSLKDAQQTIEDQKSLISRITEQTKRSKQNQEKLHSRVEQTLLQSFSSEDDIQLIKKSEGVHVSIPFNYLFSSTVPILTDDALRWLAPIAEVASQYPVLQLTVIGHSDTRPITSDIRTTYPTNWELSTARASRIVNELLTLGIPVTQLVAAGKISTKTDSPSSDTVVDDRRIEFVLKSQDAL